MSNPYFKNSYDAENNEAVLYANATNEICEIFGIEFKYITKTLLNPDHIFGEDTIKKFNNFKDITLYIENYEQYEGQGNLFSKFGFEVDNQLTCIISYNKFIDYIGKGPEIDDLIYHPNSGKIFQLKHKNINSNFYQLNGGYDRLKLTFELFIPSHEQFATNVDNIDNLNNADDSFTDDENNTFNSKVNEILNLDESNIFDEL